MAFGPPPFDHPSNFDRQQLLDGQLRAHNKIVDGQMKQANIVRDRKIYAFKREFFLAACGASEMDVAYANSKAEEAAMILYPPVTQENAEEYLLRA